jgi:hypothetical protein
VLAPDWPGPRPRGQGWPAAVKQLERQLASAEARKACAFGDDRVRLAALVRALTWKLEEAKTEVMSSGAAA